MTDRTAERVKAELDYAMYNLGRSIYYLREAYPIFKALREDYERRFNDPNSSEELREVLQSNKGLAIYRVAGSVVALVDEVLKAARSESKG